MEDISLWIIIGILAIVIIGYIIVNIVKITRLSEEEKKQAIVAYLIPLVTAAESFIGSGHGADKLELVETWFKEKAPVFYKILLFIVGKENLKDLIEGALKEVKENFGK